MNLANKLTILRMILVIVMVIIPIIGIQGEFIGISISALIIDAIFLLAALTDKLDGYIARSRNQITTFGKFLDPIADKILVLSAMLILIEMGKLPSWIPAIILTREFLISGFRLIAVEKEGKVIAASNWGKIKTVTQIIAIGFALIDPNAFGTIFTGTLTGFGLVINAITTIMMLICVVETIVSGIEYMKNGKDLFKDNSKESDKSEKVDKKEKAKKTEKTTKKE